MKYAIPLLFLLCTVSILSSCQNGNGDGQKFEDETFYNQEQNDADKIRDKVNFNDQIAKNNAIKYFENIDPQNGLVQSRVPLPSSWQKQNKGDYNYMGPNGIKIHGERSAMFMFSNDQQTNHIYQQNGMQVQFPKPIEQVINEGFMDYANKINRKLVKKYPMPQFASWDKQFDDQLYKSMPSQKTFNVMGLEWRDPDGTSFLTILHHITSYDNFGGYWGITYTVLEASENAFEQAKTQYINGLLNQEINPQWLQAINQKDMQIAQQSNATHQTRMAGIKAIGDRGTANHNARMAAMDQNMESWKVNQNAGERNQERFIDYINENTNVNDANTGQTYKVEAGANQYWMNDQGEYIKSDNSTYNPNLDPSINNQKWTEYEEQN